MENKNLYDTAIDVYSTRNKIVHKASGSRVSINYEGGVRALRCAVAIFRWFGEDSAYVVPPGTMLESKGVRFPRLKHSCWAVITLLAPHERLVGVRPFLGAFLLLITAVIKSN
jgi:hypothetical protein